MSNSSIDPKTEPLTDDMVRALRREALAAGDIDMVTQCDRALDDHPVAVSGDPRPLSRATRRDGARATCSEVINAARAADDSTLFVRVVPYSPGERP